MELWRFGEREQLAVLRMIGNRGKRQIRGENMGRAAEGWKQPFLLNEEERQGCLGWERHSQDSASGTRNAVQGRGKPGSRNSMCAQGSGRRQCNSGS